MFRDKFWLSLILTIPVVFWSAHIQELLGYRAPEFPGSDWIPAGARAPWSSCTAAWSS
jgi:P-type Cu2+ transporter